MVQGSGKGIRPALTLMAGKFHSYNLETLLPMAAAVELMHTATLVHDDAIDKSSVRRGRPTINEVWGQDIAILLGDYLFAKAGEFVSDTRNPRVIKLFSQTLATISSGEISQFLGAFNLEQTREHYFGRISSKTASLFRLATESGAILSGLPERLVGALRGYGYNLGIAFQVVDDILDFTSDETVLGKPVGSDLAQGTLTLPAMMVLERYPQDNPVKMLFTERDPSKVTAALEVVRESSIIKDCYEVAAEYSARACRHLEELPDNAHRRALVQLAEYVVRRQV